MAAILGVSVSTFKRKCRDYGIDRWPHIRKKKVGRPPHQHGEGNTSTARETPSHHVQTGMGGEPVGQNQEANVLRRDFMGGPIALNAESGLIMVARPPDQNGEKNTSTACELPSHNVETGMEIESVGQNQEANLFRRDFTEGPTSLNTENGLIIGSSSEWASQVNDQSTLSTPYQNHNALVFPQPQITSMLSENRGGSIDWRNSLASQAEAFSDTHISGSSNLAFPTWSDQVAPSQRAEGQSVQSTVYPDHNAVHCFPEGHVFESINWNEHTNSLASQAEPFSDRLISRSVSKLPDQHGERNTSTTCETPSHNVQTGMEGELFGQNEVANVLRRDFMGGPNALDTESGLIMVSSPPDQHGERNTSTACETPSHNVENEMGCQNSNPNEFQPDSFEDLNFWNTEIGSIAEILSDCDFLALEEEPSLEGLVSGSVNLTVAAGSDPAPCQHPMPTTPDTMTTTHMMPHLAVKGDVRFVTLKVTYGKRTIKFQFPLMSGIIEFKEEVKKRLKLELDSFDVEYKDEDGDCIFLGCDEDLRNHLQHFSNQVIRLLVVDSDANTANFR